jgi:predicted small lipoprotein YifL
MRNVRVWALAFTLAASTLLASGCGQKGPLVLPDAQHPHKKPKFPAPKTPSAPPAPAPGSNSAPEPAPQG